MFLGQGSKYNGKFRAADSKTLPKPWFFHQKSSKTIDFSWFSLSELPYSKSQQPTCLPRGRWRRRRNLRRVPTTSDQPDRTGDRKWTASPTEIGASPLFWATFFWKVSCTGIDMLEKWSDKKKGQTHKHRFSGRSGARPGPGFGQLNVRYQSQNLSKVVPKTSRGSLLRPY